MLQLVSYDYKGKLDATGAKTIEGDTYDAVRGVKNASNKCVIDGHVENDPNGSKEWNEQ